MAEELDYMSDEFLNQCLNSESDVRPGLLKSRSEQRQHELMKKKKLDMESKSKQSKDSSLEVIEEALKQPISCSNKGFSMLEKMGFKSGTGLGKNETGIVEPIPINIKNDRLGLGIKKKSKPSKSSKKERDQFQISEVDFRAFQSKKNKERDTLRDLRISQKVCRELDIKSNKTEPEELWFWPEDNSSETPEEEKSKSEVPDEKNELECSFTDEEKLEKLVNHLRETYYYCIWCKIQYEDEKDLQDCPGVTREDH